MRIIQEIVKYCLNTISNRSLILTEELFKKKHYVESIIFSTLAFREFGINSKPNQLIDDALGFMSYYDLISKEVGKFWNAERQSLSQLPIMLSQINNVNLRDTYEEYQNTELAISESGPDLIFDKTTRDMTGSYYTPPSIADDLVERIIQHYLVSHESEYRESDFSIASKLKFIDLSCGCGVFFEAIQNYLFKNFGISYDTSSNNFYGVDIDPIAIQLTVCSLFQKAQKKNWKKIRRNFILGNPLIHTIDEASIELKTDLFALKRYYALNMGINTNSLVGMADIVIGNPPWEKIRFEERRFFKNIAPDIAGLSQKKKREIEISKLKLTQPQLYFWYEAVSNDYSVYKSNVIEHPFLKHSLSGELNTYSLFTELTHNILVEKGYASIIVKTSMITSPSNSKLFSYLGFNKHLVSIHLFDNSKRIFSIDSREKFCILTVGQSNNETIKILMNESDVNGAITTNQRSITMREIELINPLTGMFPNIAKLEEIDLLIKIHTQHSIFSGIFPECKFGRLVHLTNHSDFINISPSCTALPIYEGKFIERYNARYATFAGVSQRGKYSPKASAKKIKLINDISNLPESRYFIDSSFWESLRKHYPQDYMVCWRSLTSTTNSRTTLAMILPTMPTSQSIQFLQIDDHEDLLLILGLMNSKPFDYLVRLKMPGIDLTQAVIKQIPVPSRERLNSLVCYFDCENTLKYHILQRVVTLLQDEPMLKPLLEEFPQHKANFNILDKSILENEIDDLFMIAYGFTEYEAINIKSSFVIRKKN